MEEFYMCWLSQRIKISITKPWEKDKIKSPKLAGRITKKGSNPQLNTSPSQLRFCAMTPALFRILTISGAIQLGIGRFNYPF
jgi:hypothetical protein